MKTNTVLEKPKQENDFKVNVSVDKILVDFINVVPTVPLNHSTRFNLIYDSKTGEIIKDIVLLPENTEPSTYSMLELSVDSDQEVRFVSDKVKSLTEFNNNFQRYIKKKRQQLEPYEKNEFDFSKFIFYKERNFGNAAGDYIIEDIIKSYKTLH